MAPKYTNAHKYIAQKFLLCGPAYRKDVNRFIAEAAQATNVQLGLSDRDLVDIFQAINGKVAAIGMRIQRVANEINGSACYVLVNNNAREVIDWKTDYSEKETDFLCKLIVEFAQSDIRELMRGDFYRIANGCKINNIDCNRIISELRDLHYIQLIRVDDGNEVYGLGIRFVAEMYDYMERNFHDDLPKCGSCKRLIFNRGVRISCQQCDEESFFHNGCKKKSTDSATGRAAGLSCGNCKEALVLTSSQ